MRIILLSQIRNMNNEINELVAAGFGDYQRTSTIGLPRDR